MHNYQFFFRFRFIYCHTIHSDTSYYRSTTDHIIKTSKETHLIQNYLETNIPNAWDCCNICIYCNHQSKQTNKKVNHKYICFIIPNTKKALCSLHTIFAFILIVSSLLISYKLKQTETFTVPRNIMITYVSVTKGQKPDKVYMSHNLFHGV